MTNKYTSNKEIEQIVRDLQVELWENAGCPRETKDILNVFNPKNLIEYKNYKFIEEENLGENCFNTQKYETAGIINHTKDIPSKTNGTVAISLIFPKPVRNFTAAHEAAHLILHPNQNGLHRDIPADYAKSEIVDYRERQADKFATYWLMPEKLLLKEILNLLQSLGGNECFLSYNPEKNNVETTSIHFNEDLSFWLTGCSTKLVSVEEKFRERESALASFRNGSRPSLSEIFGVSHKAMTHRIKELGIIIYP